MAWFCCHEQLDEEEVDAGEVRIVPRQRDGPGQAFSSHSRGIDLNKPLPETPAQSVGDLVPTRQENWPLLDNIIVPAENRCPNPNDNAAHFSLSKDFVLNSPNKRLAQFSLPPDLQIEDPGRNSLGIFMPLQESGCYPPSHNVALPRAQQRPILFEDLVQERQSVHASQADFSPLSKFRLSSAMSESSTNHWDVPDPFHDRFLRSTTPQSVKDDRESLDCRPGISRLGACRKPLVIHPDSLLEDHRASMSASPAPEDNDLDIRSSVSTEIQVFWDPVIVHEGVTSVIHHVEHPVISRDIHSNEIRRLVQPVEERVTLPTRHLADVGPGGSLVEVSAEFAAIHLTNTHERLVLAETPIHHTYTMPAPDTAPIRVIYVESPQFLADHDGRARPHSTIGIAL